MLVGVDVEVDVAVGGTGVDVNVSVGGTGVCVDVGVIVGPNICPGPQLESIIVIRSSVFLRHRKVLLLFIMPPKLDILNKWSSKIL